MHLNWEWVISPRIEIGLWPHRSLSVSYANNGSSWAKKDARNVSLTGGNSTHTISHQSIQATLCISHLTFVSKSTQSIPRKNLPLLCRRSNAATIWIVLYSTGGGWWVYGIRRTGIEMPLSPLLHHEGRSSFIVKSSHVRCWEAINSRNDRKKNPKQRPGISICSRCCCFKRAKTEPRVDLIISQFLGGLSVIFQNLASRQALLCWDPRLLKFVWLRSVPGPAAL